MCLLATGGLPAVVFAHYTHGATQYASLSGRSHTHRIHVGTRSGNIFACALAYARRKRP